MCFRGMTATQHMRHLSNLTSISSNGHKYILFLFIVFREKLRLGIRLAEKIFLSGLFLNFREVYSIEFLEQFSFFLNGHTRKSLWRTMVINTSYFYLSLLRRSYGSAYASPTNRRNYSTNRRKGNFFLPPPKTTFFWLCSDFCLKHPSEAIPRHSYRYSRVIGCLQTHF